VLNFRLASEAVLTGASRAELRPVVYSLMKESAPVPRYKVMVDDNFHYMGSEERREHGTYETVEEAIAACREIVDRSLKAGYEPGIPAEVLYDGYVSFGDDPFIVMLDGTDDNAKFSAWSYAKEHSRVICGER
jgi:hypothetical protein